MARAGGFFVALIALMLLFMVTNLAQALDSSAFEASLDAAEEAVASALRAARVSEKGRASRQVDCCRCRETGVRGREEERETDIEAHTQDRIR